MSEIEKPLSIPSHWTWTTFDGIGSWTGGGTPSKRKDEYWDGDIPWVSPKDMKRLEIEDAEDHITSEAVAESSAKMIPAGSLLFVTRSGILEHTLPTAAAKVDLTINQDLKALTPHGNADTAFLLHYTRAVALPILRACSKDGTTVASLESERLYNYPVPVPPLPEQRRIVDKIEELFSNLHAGVVSLKTARRQVDRYRQSVLQAAVEGRLTADWRQSHDPEPAEELLERILEERRAQWEKRYRWRRYDSKGKEPPGGWKDRYKPPGSADPEELSDLPPSWTWVPFEQISLLDSGKAFKSKNFRDEGMPLLRGANVAPGHLKWDDTQYWPADDVAKYEHLLINEGDVILAMDRPLISSGLKIARAKKTDIPCLLVQRVARFKPMLEDLTPYLYLVCNTQRFIQHLSEGQTGTQIPHVSKKGIRAFHIPLPPLAEAKQIFAEVERLLSVADDTVATIDRELQRAERLRQSILKQAFSGKLVALTEGVPQASGDGEVSAGTQVELGL
jgi:type I restriction enzyme S subunit